MSSKQNTLYQLAKAENSSVLSPSAIIMDSSVHAHISNLAWKAFTSCNLPTATDRYMLYMYQLILPRRQAVSPSRFMRTFHDTLRTEPEKIC